MFLKDLFFPKFCIGCGFLGTYICLNCQQKLFKIEKEMCVYCGRFSIGGYTHPGCVHKNGIDRFIVLYQYSSLLKKIIKSIKYRLVVDMWKEFSVFVKPEIMKKLHKESSDVFYDVQAIPLNKKKQHMRGFNQSDLIADDVLEVLGSRKVDLLILRKITTSQAMQKSIKQRYINLKNAFIWNKTTLRTSRQVMLVDDVFTSGATTSEACKILKNNGVNNVCVFAIAKG